MKKVPYLFTDKPQDEEEDCSARATPLPNGVKNRRQKFSFSGAVNRILNDVDACRFPIKRRKRDCERIALPIAMINRLHEDNETKKLQEYIAQLFRAAVFDEDLEQ